MGMFSDDAGKTEKATPGRLRQARDKGQTAVSKEFTMAGSLLIAVLAIQFLGFWLMDAFREVIRRGAGLNLDEASVAGLQGEILAVAKIVLPPFLTLLVIFALATAVFGYSQIGFKLSKEAFAFKPERLNPVSNLGKLFKFSSLMRAIMSFFKLSILAGVLYFVLRTRWADLASMYGHRNLPLSADLVADLALTIFLWIAIVVLALSVVDVVWQRFDFQKNMMMTKQEVQDERKRVDGDPLIKSRLRSARMEFMRHRMMESVPKADVVITNPSHYSVALRYERSKQSAPEVVAKGVEKMALRIREIATEHNVPLMEDPPLARALYRAVKVGAEIPPKFYKAVAVVLGHVFRLKDKVA